MQKQIMILYLCLMLMYACGAKAQLAWQHVDGLPCEEASSVVQDSEGFIWIGTRLALIRYDGYRPTVFRNDINHPYVFSSSNILSLSTDNDKHIFAGSFFGLNTMDLNTHETEICHFEGNDYVRAVLNDTYGRLWVGTDYGLFLVSNRTQKELFSPIPLGVVMQVKETNKGYVVITTGHHGIYMIDQHNKCAAVSGTEKLLSISSFQDKNGTLWVGTNHQGLYRTKEAGLEHCPGFDDCVINDLVDNPMGEGVILATDKGVFTYPVASDMPSLTGVNVKSLFIDRQKNVWAATEMQGVFRLQNHALQFRTFKRRFTRQAVSMISQFEVGHLDDSLAWSNIAYINAIYEDHEGTTYVGSWRDGIYAVSKGRIIQHLTMEGTPWLKTNSIYAFASVNKESMLLGSWNGLYKMEKDYTGSFVGRVGNSDISNMHTLAISAFGEDDVWLGLVGGVAHIKGSINNPSKAQITVYTHVNRKGTVEPEDVGKLTDHHDETGEYQLGGVYRIVKDKYGHIWACTSEPGLLRYDPQSDVFRSVSEDMGILGDNVHSMEIDSEGCFWMTTNYGILRMQIDGEGNPIAQQLYTTNDGLQSNYFGSTMTSRLQNGDISFLNQHNLVTVTPNESWQTADEDKVQVTEILINNRPLDSKLARIDAMPPFTTCIVCPHDMNNLTISFSSLSFGHEASIRYGYRLEGIDREEQQTNMGNNTISYQQLPPGTYTLHFYPLTNGQHKAETEQTIKLVILQPLWWTWWARMIYVLLLALGGYTAVRIVNDRKKKQRLLEALEMEKQQQEQMYQNKLQFYMRVLHELLTPITLIKDMAHELHEKVRPSLQSALFMLTNQTDRVVEAMNNIIVEKDDSSAQEALQKAKEMTQVDRDFLRKCTESVNRHISDPDYTHQVMMQEVGASHATLYRKLKTITGMDATAFVRVIRMRTACQILTNNPDIRIGELAEKVGFSNPRYFSTCFKNEYGMTPTEWINKDKKENKNDNI